MPGVEEVAAIGYGNDRSEAGHIRMRSQRGSVVAIPFRTGGYFAIDSVGGGSGVAFNSGLIVDNEAGNMTNANFVCGGTGFGFGTRLTHQFFGPIYGLSLLRSNTAYAFDCMGVVIDGEAYPVKQVHDWLSLRSLNILDAYGLSFVAEDLPDLPGGKPHVAEIIASSYSTVVQRVFGYVVDAQAGYQSVPHSFNVLAGVAVTNADVAISLGSAGITGRTLRKVVYYNSDVTARIVTVKQGSSILEVISIPAGKSAAYDPGILIAPATSGSVLTHTVDSASAVVTATVYVGI